MSFLLNFARPFLAAIPGVGPFLALVPPGGWKIIAIVVALGAGVIYVDRHATYKERAKCNARALQAQLAAAQIDRDAFREQAERANEAAGRIEKERNDADERARQLAEDIAKRPASGRCPLSDDAVKRLR